MLLPDLVSNGQKKQKNEACLQREQRGDSWSSGTNLDGGCCDFSLAVTLCNYVVKMQFKLWKLNKLRSAVFFYFFFFQQIVNY